MTLEETGANTETDKQFIYNTYTDLLKDVDAKPGMTKTETYEEWAKALFTKEPANMKLLVVVDKLLTGFDAPPCTYLYIDKSMQDHGLFQAICRTNRLDGEDKDFGYIVDYKDLFKKVENAIAVYTAELDRSAGGCDPEVLLQDRLKKGKERLDTAIESLALLCEPVEPPKGELQHMHYFCGNTEIASDLKEREPRRTALYQATVALVRAYANIADELDTAGYSTSEIHRIKEQVDHYLNSSGDYPQSQWRDARPQGLRGRHAAPHRHLYRGGRAAKDFALRWHEPSGVDREDRHLQCDQHAARWVQGKQERRCRDHRKQCPQQDPEGTPGRPELLRKMSTLLDEIIADRKAEAIEYEEYLRRIARLAREVEEGLAEDTPEQLKNSPALRALYNNLKMAGGTTAQADRVAEAPEEYDASVDPVLEKAKKIDAKVKQVRPDEWRGVQAREQVIKAALYGILQDEAEVERIFLIIKAQREY